MNLIGDKEILQSIDSISISQDIDISKAKKKYAKTIDLKNYIPEEVTIDGETTVKIEIEISPLASKTLTIQSSKIKIRNKGDNQVKVLDDVKITLQGENKVISKISLKNISASINVDKLSKGDHSVPVEVEVPEGVAITEEVSVSINIK